MLKKAIKIWKTQGFNGLFHAFYHRAFPRRFTCYQDCNQLFQDRTGLEIGGPSKIFTHRGLFPVYVIAARIDNCNFSGETIWEGAIEEGTTFHYGKQQIAGTQYIAEATNLSHIATASYDFVISSHMLEHSANPLQALNEWTRVIKEGGTLALILPHKDGTFDHRRPVTLLSHLIQDFESQIDEGDMTHLKEILELHDLTMDPDAGDFETFEYRSRENMKNRCLHHHVFDTRLAVEIIDYMKLQILAVETVQPYHILVVAQKPVHGQSVINDDFRRLDKMPLRA
jgi:SAM-dependent methyltransferase